MGTFEPKHFYTVQELTDLFGLTRQTIYKEIKTGRIEAYIIAGEYRIPAEALEKLKYKPEPGRTRPARPSRKGKTEPKPAIILDDEREQ